ncbi:MAG: DUF4290 domain-containing protein, partial [Leeuwenhoekiella sp.]
IANHMKKSFLNWNKDTVDDDVIFKHLFELSNGGINLAKKDEDLRDTHQLLRPKKMSKSNSSPRKKTNRPKKRY